VRQGYRRFVRVRRRPSLLLLIAYVAVVGALVATIRVDQRGFCGGGFQGCDSPIAVDFALATAPFAAVLAAVALLDARSPKPRWTRISATVFGAAAVAFVLFWTGAVGEIIDPLFDERELLIIE